MINNSKNKHIAYVGTYTDNGSRGIYGFSIDSSKGTVEDLGLLAELQHPTYLTIASNNKYLYSVIKKQHSLGDSLGGVAAFSIDSQSGKLRLLNYEVASGKPPCHISADRCNKYLFTANYHEGRVMVHPINLDGSLCPSSSAIIHEGFGKRKERQEKPHVHYVTLTTDEKHLCAVDLGIDKVMLYDFNSEDGTLSPSNIPFIQVKPGSGPRHMTFSHDGKFAYVINELSSDILVLEYDNKDLCFKEIQYISALPKEYDGISYGAAIHITPNNEYLYASNRGHDSLAIFKINKTTGGLQFLCHCSTLGNFPRDFVIDPTGNFVFVANQNSNTVIPFAIVKESNRLEQVSEAIKIPSPVCIKILSL